jgi:hypothetical protein
VTALENGPRTALLVIDVQNGVVGEAFEHSDGGLLRSTPEWEIVPELAPRDGEAAGTPPRTCAGFGVPIGPEEVGPRPQPRAISSTMRRASARPSGAGTSG